MTRDTVWDDPIEVARRLISIDQFSPAFRARLGAAFARQALEDALLTRYGIEDRKIPRRPLLAFARAHEPEFGAKAATAWLHLTWATHQRTDEVDPDLETIAQLVNEVEELISG